MYIFVDSELLHDNKKKQRLRKTVDQGLFLLLFFLIQGSIETSRYSLIQFIQWIVSQASRGYLRLRESCLNRLSTRVNMATSVIPMSGAIPDRVPYLRAATCLAQGNLGHDNIGRQVSSSSLSKAVRQRVRLSSLRTQATSNTSLLLTMSCQVRRCDPEMVSFVGDKGNKIRNLFLVIKVYYDTLQQQQ